MLYKITKLRTFLVNKLQEIWRARNGTWIESQQYDNIPACVLFEMFGVFIVSLYHNRIICVYARAVPGRKALSTRPGLQFYRIGFQLNILFEPEQKCSNLSSKQLTLVKVNILQGSKFTPPYKFTTFQTISCLWGATHNLALSVIGSGSSWSYKIFGF